MMTLDQFFDLTDEQIAEHAGVVATAVGSVNENMTCDDCQRAEEHYTYIKHDGKVKRLCSRCTYDVIYGRK